MLTHEFSDDEIGRARRAYYASISYIDRMIGDILDVLRNCGLAENTAIVFTSDHGEMLGERGIWFKKHFYEDSLKIPLILSAPWLQPERVSTNASLVDLLPTFCGLALGEPWSSPVEDLEGMDLTTLIGKQTDPSRAVFAEYLAEATPAPIFMIRQNEHKFIWSETDPPMLYNVADDPNEMCNLATDTAFGELVEKFTKAVFDKWDVPAITSDIKLSQRRRKLVRSSMTQGVETRWNHGEAAGQDTPWYRGEGSYNDWAFSYLKRNQSTDS
ncbi:MAG: sulfatase-like hydrolase/transferase, partial [Paracoccaceae bacterium]|nr:sulfatase-like hydrolase/transferase [Paracoccaceae bacterium]